MSIYLPTNKTAKLLSKAYVAYGGTKPLTKAYTVISGKTKELWSAFDGVLYESGKENVTLSFPGISQGQTWAVYDSCGQYTVSAANVSKVCERVKNSYHIYLKALKYGSTNSDASVYTKDLLNVKKYNTAKITFVNLLKQSYSYVRFMAYTDNMYSPLKSNMVAVKNYGVNSVQTLSLDISSIDECRFLFSCEVQSTQGGTNEVTGASVKITKIWLE